MYDPKRFLLRQANVGVLSFFSNRDGFAAVVAGDGEIEGHGAILVPDNCYVRYRQPSHRFEAGALSLRFRGRRRRLDIEGHFRDELVETILGKLFSGENAIHNPTMNLKVPDSKVGSPPPSNRVKVDAYIAEVLEKTGRRIRRAQHRRL